MHRVIAFTVSGARRKYFCAEDDGEWLFKKLRVNSKKLVRLELWLDEELLKSVTFRKKRKSK